MGGNRGGSGHVNDKLLFYYNSAFNFSTLNFMVYRCKITRLKGKVLLSKLVRGNFLTP